MALRKTSELSTVAGDQPMEDVAQELAGAPSAEVKKRTKDRAKAAFYKDFKQQGVALLEAEKETGEAEKAGSMSDKVAFLHPLGNPTKVGTRTEKGRSEIPTIEIIGYAFKALANVQVPVIDRVGIPKINPMGYNNINWVPVKKGETFILTRAELGEMVMQVEYAGAFTGDPENQVELTVTVSKVAGNAYAPLTILKKVIIDENTSPIKANIVPVAVKKEGATGNGIKDYTVLPEYDEKFGYLFEEVKSVGRARGSAYQKREKGQSAAELAAAMRAFRRKSDTVQ